MARIGSTLSGIERSLLNRLAEANAATTLSAMRMATGRKVNAAADDPAAFMALSGLQTQLSGVQATIANVNAAAGMVTQTQTSLAGVRTQLSTIRTELLKDEGQTLTEPQRAECQAKIDAAIEQINALAGTRIDGRAVLDGSANFRFAGRNETQVAEVVVDAVRGSGQTISGSVAAAATRAYQTYTGDASDQVTVTAAFTLTGSRGSVAMSVTAGQALSAVAQQVNNQSHLTGITASVDTETHTLTLTAVDYGSAAGVAVAVTSGTFDVAGADGTDASATINGKNCTGQGNRVSVNDNGFRFSVEFAAGFSGALDAITVEGDALQFALSTQLGRSATVAIPGVQAARLGGESGTLDQLQTGGDLDGLGTHTSQAIRVVDEALDELTRIEGAVDGFYNAAIGSASSLLADLQDDLQDAIDSIDEVDDTEEALVQAHCQALASNAVSGLAMLYQQRMSIVAMIQQIAGLT